MATATNLRPRAARDASRPTAPKRFDRRLGQLLRHATEVFCDKGYEGASMRDLSRASGMSLAGLYYYFESKEKLLYLIQKHTFTTIMERLRGRLAGVSDPAQRLHLFIQNHLEYFLAHQAAMKVLSHEDEVLKNGYGSEVRALKREYYRTCLELMDDLKRAAGVESAKRNGVESRIAVLSLFGMMNWIYTWYNPRLDGDAESLARQMGEIFLQGVQPAAGKRRRRAMISYSNSRRGA